MDTTTEQQQVDEGRLPVPDVSDLEQAFPANALQWMPPRDQIPDEFHWHLGRSEWVEIANTWFMQGLNPKAGFRPRPGVDARKALKVIQATLGSFAPKHEHKIEAVAYMLSEWFSKVENWKPQPKKEASS